MSPANAMGARVRILVNDQPVGEVESNPKRTATLRPSRLPKHVRMWIGFVFSCEDILRRTGKPARVQWIEPDEAKRRGLLADV